MESFKIAFTVSKLPLIKEKIYTKYHRVLKSDDLQSQQFQSKHFTKFHKSIYKDHILELANDLSDLEQEVSAEVLAEPELVLQPSEELELEPQDIEDLIQSDTSQPGYVQIPEGSRVIKIIVMKGVVVQKVYSTIDNKKISISF